jgi:hypothetical protein
MVSEGKSSRCRGSGLLSDSLIKIDRFVNSLFLDRPFGLAQDRLCYHERISDIPNRELNIRPELRLKLL